MPFDQPFVIRAARLFDGSQMLDATHLRVAVGRIDALGGPQIVGRGDDVVDG